MGASITLAGESLIAQKQGGGQPLNISRFVLANVPGLNPNAAVDRAAGKPPGAQVVGSYGVTQKGYVNPNQVVYSLMMGSDIGDFDWNWLGLESAEGVLFAVAYVPLQQKRKNIPPLQLGNNVTRNFLVVFDGAQALTGITIDASTWQHDFTVRLMGIDERERLSNRDIFGRACFFDDALQVEKVGTGYQLKPGVVYVEGIRVELASSLPITLPSVPTQVWIGVSLRREFSDMVSNWTVSCSPCPPDYQEGDSRLHCIALANIASGGAVTDLRVVEPIDGPLIQHFAARVGYYPGLRTGAADKLSQPRKINGVAFDGSADITVEDNTKVPLSGGTLTGGLRFSVPQIGGGLASWQERQSASHIDCPLNLLAYSVWKSTNWSERHLAAMDVYSGGSSSSIPMVVLHVGALSSAFTFDGEGHLSIRGSYYGDGGKLSGLDARAITKGTLPAARLSGTYNIDVSGNAATTSQLVTPRTINGVPFDGTQNISIADASKMPLTGGVLTGSARFSFSELGGAFVHWRTRTPAIQVDCPNNGLTYLLWKATNWNDRHIGAMEAFSNGGTGMPAQIVTHVGGTDNAMTLAEGGHLSITGIYSGNAAGLTNLPRATPNVPGAVFKNVASLGPNGWWKCAETGRIKQWGITLGASDTVTHRSFPIAFPSACTALVASRTSLFYSDVTSGTNTLIVSRERFSVISGPFDSPDEIYWMAEGY